MNSPGATKESAGALSPLSEWSSHLAAGFVIFTLAAFCLVVFFSWGGNALHLRLGFSAILGLVLLSTVLFLSGRLRVHWPQPTPVLLLGILAIGVMLRIFSAISFHPQPYSDYAEYEWSARHLLLTGEYVCRDGEYMLRAFRPPGTAFLLAATMWVTGGGEWSALTLNCICFVATVILLWRAAFFVWPLMSPAIAVLYAFWPTDVLTSSFPNSEGPSQVIAAALIYLLVRPMPIFWRVVAFNLVVGLSCLIRNSNLAMIAVSALVILQQPLSLARRTALIVLSVVCAFAPIAPWTMRNYKLLGSPVLVATNGGRSLYSANNPNADGTFEPTSVAKIRKLLPDEVKVDKVGSALAREWIAEHPLAFAKLALQKMRIVLSSDDWGAYAAMERGNGYTGFWYTAAKLISNLWWIMVWTGVLLTMRNRFDLLRRDRRLIAIVSTTVGPALLFLFFEAQARYHAFMIPGLLWIAGQQMRPKVVGENEERPH
jgi:hypothetical protein